MLTSLVQSPFFFSLLQVNIVYRVSFSFRLNDFQCPFVLKDSLICFAHFGEGEYDFWYVRGDFLTTFCHLNFKFFVFGNFFSPMTFTHTHDPYAPDPRHLATLVFKSLETFLNRFNFSTLMRRKVKLLETYLNLHTRIFG